MCFDLSFSGVGGGEENSHKSVGDDLVEMNSKIHLYLSTLIENSMNFISLKHVSIISIKSDTCVETIVCH